MSDNTSTFQQPLLVGGFCRSLGLPVNQNTFLTASAPWPI